MITVTSVVCPCLYTVKTRVSPGRLFVTRLFVDLLGGNGVIWKLVTSVLVVVLNYFASKFLVFRK